MFYGFDRYYILIMKKFPSSKNPVKIALAATLLVALAFSTPAFAKKPKGGDAAPKAQEYTLTQANAVSVTISSGVAGDPPKTFKITDATTITLNGLPAKGGDLRGGMIAEIALTPDNTTALSISATDPKKMAPSTTPAKGKKGKKQ